MRCLTDIADELVVLTTSLRGRDNNGIYRSPIHADLYETGRAAIHRNKGPHLDHAMRDDSAKPEASALVPALLFSFRSFNFPKKFLK